MDVVRNLVGGERSPSAFIVYFYLWSQNRKSVRVSHHGIAEATGLSKSAVQGALRLLNRRKLIRSVHQSRTAIPEHSVVRK